MLLVPLSWVGQRRGGYAHRRSGFDGKVFLESEIADLSRDLWSWRTYGRCNLGILALKRLRRFHSQCLIVTTQAPSRSLIYFTWRNMKVEKAGPRLVSTQ